MSESTTNRWTLLWSATLFAALLLAACTTTDAMPSDVQVVVELRDGVITLAPASMPAGAVKIGVHNLGTMTHEFELIRTELPADKLAIDAQTAKAKTDGLVKQILNIPVGGIAVTTAQLEAGHYVVICNQPGHYQLGQRADLRVVPPGSRASPGLLDG